MEFLNHWGESQGYIRLASQKTGLKPGFVTMIILVAALLLLYQGLVGGFVLFFLGVVIPAYQSFRAVESPNKEDDVKMLNYWCVFSLFFAINGFLEPILSFVPLAGIIKFVIITALSMNDYTGSTLVYNYAVAPLLRTYQHDIDKAYAKVGETMTELAESAKEKVKENVGKLGEKATDIASSMGQSVKESVGKAAEKVGDLAESVGEKIGTTKKTE